MFGAGLYSCGLGSPCCTVRQYQGEGLSLCMAQWQLPVADGCSNSAVAGMSVAAVIAEECN